MKPISLGQMYAPIWLNFLFQAQKQLEDLKVTHTSLISDHETLQKLHQQLNNDYEALSQEQNSLKTSSKALARELKAIKVSSFWEVKD